MRLWLFHVQPFHQPAILLRGQQTGFRLTARLLETAGLQTLVQQQKAILFPLQGFDPVPASAAEQEQCVGERVQVKLLLYNACQAINSPPEVGESAGDIIPCRLV